MKALALSWPRWRPGRRQPLLRAPVEHPGGWGLAFTFAFLGLLVGAAIVVLPWYLAVGLVLFPLLLLMGATWPYASMMLVLALIFEAIPGRVVPKLGTGRVYEVILAYITVTCLLRALWHRRPVLRPIGEFAWPLYYLAACALASAVYVKYFSPNKDMLAELRGQSTWLLLPMICFLVDGRRRLDRLVLFLLFSGFMIACYSIAQSLLHVHIMSDRVEALDTRNTDVTRSIVGPSIYIVTFAVLWGINKLSAWSGVKILIFLLLSVGAAAIGVSFGRGIWIATSLGILVASFVSGGVSGLAKAALAVGLAATLAVCALGVAKPRLLDAMIQRAEGVTTEVESGGSFQWRFIEARFAMTAIERHPFTGVGLGGQYKPHVSMFGGFEGETHYIHDAYIGLMLKMGIQAILFPIAMIGLFYWKVYRLRSRVDKPYRALFGAVAGGFLIPLITSFTQPEWIAPPGVAALSVLVALLCCIERHGLVEDTSGRPAA